MPDPQQQTVDYDALAAAHGGVAPAASPVDYDALAAQHGGASAPSAQAGSSAESWLKSLVSYLPAGGATLGGILGGMPGAALGGAAGEGYKQLVQHGAEILPALADVARNAFTQPIATAQGAEQGANQGAKATALEAGSSALGEGAAQLAGKAATAAAPGAARWLMDRAMNPTDRLAREFPNLSDTAIENAIAVSKGGMEKARAILRSAKAVANGALAKADAAGATVSVDDARAGLSNTLNKIMSSSDIAGDMQTLGRVERDVAVGRKPDLTLTEADALKTQLQQEAKAAYARFRAPNGTPALAVEAEAKKDMAASLNIAINKAAILAGAPGYSAANATAQELIGVNRAMVRATQAGPNVLRLMVRPTIGATVGSALGYEQGRPGLGALAGMYASTPASMSRMAILLGHPIAQQVLRQVPRPLLQAIIQQLQPTEDPPSGGAPQK